MVYRDKALEKRDRLILFRQTLRDVQSLSYEIEASDMLYSEFQEMCRKAWVEKFNYLCIDMTKYENEGIYRIFNGSKSTYNERFCESELTQKKLQLKIQKI